jgi:translation elongation factor EF-1beta
VTQKKLRDLPDYPAPSRAEIVDLAGLSPFEEEPVAFGLVALVAHLIIPEDAEGRWDEVEGRLKSLDGISEVQVLVSRRV